MPTLAPAEICPHLEREEVNAEATPPNETKSLLERCHAIDSRLPPAPWAADIDDPDTDPSFTGKFDHPPTPQTALALYDDPQAAKDLATMRNLFHELLEAVDRQMRDWYGLKTDPENPPIAAVRGY